MNFFRRNPDATAFAVVSGGVVWGVYASAWCQDPGFSWLSFAVAFLMWVTFTSVMTADARYRNHAEARARAERDATSFPCPTCGGVGRLPKLQEDT